jgi:predicted phosphoribosyltransferase
MFENRKDAGQRLAKTLEKYKGKNVLILAIPRGGVEVGYHIAKYLEGTFSVLIARKLPFPYDKEAGFGAIAEDGNTFIFDHATTWIDRETIEEIVRIQKNEIKRRIAVLRKNRSLPKIENKTVILVDDGIAMGSTMRTAITLCKNKGAKKIAVAVPVAGEETVQEIRGIVDEIIVLEIPRFFHAVAQVYKNWYDVSDQEVIRILEEWEAKNQ